MEVKMESQKPRDFGFARVALAVPKVKVADPEFNAGEICSLVEKAKDYNVDILLFPELCVTGYTAGDLFNQEILAKKSLEALQKIIGIDAGSMAIVLGASNDFF